MRAVTDTNLAVLRALGLSDVVSNATLVTVRLTPMALPQVEIQRLVLSGDVRQSEQFDVVSIQRKATFDLDRVCADALERIRAYVHLLGDTHLALMALNNSTDRIDAGVQRLASALAIEAAANGGVKA